MNFGFFYKYLIIERFNLASCWQSLLITEVHAEKVWMNKTIRSK